PNRLEGQSLRLRLRLRPSPCRARALAPAPSGRSRELAAPRQLRHPPLARGVRPGRLVAQLFGAEFARARGAGARGHNEARSTDERRAAGTLPLLANAKPPPD